MKKLDRYLTKPDEERTWKDRIADAAMAAFIIASVALLWILRGGIL